MIRFALLALFALTGVAVAASHAVAGPPIAYESQIFVEHVRTDANGRESRVLSMPGQIGPGDRLVFVVRYRNAGRNPVGGYAMTNAVPPTLRIDPGQPDMRVSVDGGRNWGRLGALSIPTALGGTRRATAEDVTHIRWPLAGAIAPGRGGRITYRATVR